MADPADARWYTTTPKALQSVLGKLPTLGTPTKANSAWLSSIGHGGGNSRSALRVMKNVGLTEADGTPTDLWHAFKGGDRRALADGVRAGYAELFQIYPDADQKDAEALLSFFRSNTKLGATAQKLCVQTFQILASYSDFHGTTGASTPPAERRSVPASTRSEAADAPTSLSRVRGNLGLTVNIQLQLPATADADVYDKLFESMAKHLRGLIEVE